MPNDQKHSSVVKQNSAPTGSGVKIVTGFVLLMNAGLFAAALVTPFMLLAAVFLVIVLGLCYAHAPTAYELRGRYLIVISRVGEKQIGPVYKISAVDHRPAFGIRLWGNGGLFAVTGIFWAKSWGVFRVYVTRAGISDLVAVETQAGKVLISPEHPRDFISLV